MTGALVESENLTDISGVSTCCQVSSDQVRSDSCPAWPVTVLTKIAILHFPFFLFLGLFYVPLMPSSLHVLYD